MVNSTERTWQAYASLSIGLLCLLVGLPLWWKTTDVYRVQLPYSKIAELSAKQVLYSVHVTIITFEDVDGTELAIFGESLKESLEDDKLSSDSSSLTVKYWGNMRQAFEEERLVLRGVQTIEELDQKLDDLKLLEDFGRYSFILLPLNSTLLFKDSIVTGKYRSLYVRHRKDLGSLVSPMKNVIKSVLVEEERMVKSYEASTGLSKLQDDRDSMRSVKTTPGYDLTFTLLNPEPDMLDVQWDIKTAVEDYLNPFLDKMGAFLNITLSSQVLYYTKLNLRQHKEGIGNNTIYFLKTEDLPHMINPIESKLGSHVTNYPTLNFITYVPARDQSPLIIHDEKGNPSQSNSFLSPRWGGVLIYNMFSSGVTSKNPYTVHLDMVYVMEVFLAQLHLLMGLHTHVNLEELHYIKLDNSGISAWMLDVWLREKALENCAVSTATLSSLAKLLNQIRNMVEEAVSNIEKTHSCLVKGDLRDAYLASRQAIISSEKAFFDSSLLELLYFPEDQKFAIYIPLFLPIGIPILMSLFHSIKFLRGKDKTTS